MNPEDVAQGYESKLHHSHFNVNLQLRSNEMQIISHLPNTINSNSKRLQQNAENSTHDMQIKKVNNSLIN